MPIDFDPPKDAVNRGVHGISLVHAEALLAGFTLGWIDDRHDYGEVRHVAIGEVAGRVFVCVYTLRGGAPRAISLRPANRKERHAYHQAKAAQPGQG